MAITAAGAFFQNGTSGSSTVGYTSTSLGDVVILGVTVGSLTIHSTAITGGGCTTWTHLAGPVSDTTEVVSVDLWMGTVTTAATAVTATVTYSAAIGTTGVELEGQQFTAGLGAGTVWTVDKFGTLDNTTGSTTMQYPSLVATGANELYVGLGVPSGAGTAGSTPGFSYLIDTVFTNVLAYNLAASGTLAPTAGNSTASQSVAAAALLIPSATVTVTATATLAGAGTFAATPTNVRIANSALSGAGSLTAAPAVATSSTLSGAGTLAATQSLILPATATLAGAGTLTASAVLALPVVAALAGAGGVTSATPIVGNAAVLAGTGSLTAAAGQTLLVAAALGGAGSLFATPGGVQFVSATLAGTGGLGSTPAAAAAATFAGAGSLGAGPVLTRPATATLAGAGLLGAADLLTVFPTALLAGAGSITAANAGSAYVPYVPEGWTDNSLATPLSAARMTYMETGMVQIDTSQQGKAALFVPTVEKTSAYSAAGNDLVPVNLSAGSVAVTLPSAPADKTQIAVEIVVAGVGFTCSVLTSGVDVFYRAGGSTTYPLSALGQTAVFEYRLTGALWHVVSAGVPVSTLDTRYVGAVAAGDATVTVGGTATAPTVAVNAIPESKVTNLVTDLASKVTGVTAGNTTITVGGTAAAPTVALGTVPESAVTNLTTDLAAKAPAASPTFTGVVTVPHVVAVGTAPTAAAGANNGATPPVPLITGNDTRGTVSFGSGTAPAAGAQAVITFTTAYAAAPVVTLTPTSSAFQALGHYLTAVSTTGFTVSTTTAPAASQANTAYSGNFHVIG